MCRGLPQLALCLLLACGAGRSVASDNEALHAQALQAWREHRYPAAYGRLARLADAGHVPAAELALVMVRHGRTLFGSDWAATQPQLRRWNALVINHARGRMAVAEDGHEDR